MDFCKIFASYQILISITVLVGGGMRAVSKAFIEYGTPFGHFLASFWLSVANSILKLGLFCHSTRPGITVNA